MYPRSLFIACLSTVLIWTAITTVVSAQSSSFYYQQQQRMLQQQQMQRQQRQMQEQQRRLQQQQLQQRQQQQRQLELQRQQQQTLQRQQQLRLQEQRRQQQLRQQQLQAQRQQQRDQQRRLQEQNQRSQKQQAANENLKRQQTISKQRATEKLRKLAFEKQRRERLQKERRERERVSSTNAIAALLLLNRVRASHGGGGSSPPPNETAGDGNNPPRSRFGSSDYKVLATGETTSVGKYRPSQPRHVIGATGKSALYMKQRAEVRQAEKKLLAKVKKNLVINTNNDIKVLPVPTVSDPKLANIVRDLYKGTKAPNPIGTGSTADAIRNEFATGSPTHGVFHSKKGEQYLRALDNWLKKNPGASDHDRLVAESLKRDLESALRRD